MSDTENSPAPETSLTQRRRQQIYVAAVELFARQGYYKTTIQDIARKADVSPGLIYQYCKDKDDVLLMVLLNVTDAYNTQIPQAIAGETDALKRFKIVIAAYCRIVDSMREATVLAYRSTKSLPADKRQVIKQKELETNRIISKCIEACVGAGLFRTVNVEFATYQIVMFAHGWGLKHWRYREVITLEDYIAEGTEFFLRALRT